jgi:sortase A
MAHDDHLKPNGDHNAADVIRDKVSRIYSEEPDASKELEESEESSHRSKHQKFMYELSTSGKDLVTIQTEWHNYYQKLPPKEKHQVWQEFYASQPSATGQHPTPTPHSVAEHKHQVAGTNRAKRKKIRDARSKKEVQEVIKDKVSAGGKLEAKHHLQSLLFGLGIGLLVVVVFMFGFFNEVIISPFIQPSRAQASTPLIVTTDSVAPTDKQEVIIPKINAEIPIDFTQTTTDEDVIEGALENGVVHYPTTSKPGENGNTAYFGHSSNNIFNKGKYKFAFVLLHTLEPGDTFYLTYNGKVYVYKVFSKRIVDPSEVSVLNPIDGHPATATLITCDPPGTSLHRLIIAADQISPSPSGNTQAAPAAVNTAKTENLPGNGPTLLGRFARTFVGKVIIIAVLTGLFVWVLKRTNQFVGRLLK